jgi:PAS domain S-box-containing protein
MNEDSNAAAFDVVSLLDGAFPGHTMRRLRTPDGKYRYTYVSAEVRAAFGLDAERMILQDAVDHAWVHPEDRARFVDALERSAAELSTLDEEIRVELPDGGYKWVRSMGRPRRTEDGTVIWDGVALDVTERREAVAALQRALNEARRSEISEGRFAFIAASDFQRPLEELRDAVAALEQVSGAASPEVVAAIDRTVQGFRTFTRALVATRDLVRANSASGDAPASGPKPVFSRLTRRQQEILRLVHQGASNQDISEALDITPGTVKLHMSAILKRTGARNRTEAARICLG